MTHTGFDYPPHLAGLPLPQLQFDAPSSTGTESRRRTDPNPGGSARDGKRYALPGQTVPLPETDQQPPELAPVADTAAGFDYPLTDGTGVLSQALGNPGGAPPAPVNLEGAPPGVTPEAVEMYLKMSPADFTDAIANATLEDMDALEWAFKLRPPGG